MAWWLRLLRYALPHRNGLVLVLLLMLTGVLVGMLRPWPLKLIVDYVLKGEPLPDSVGWFQDLAGASSSSALLGWLAVGTVGLFLAQRAIKIVQAYIKAGVGSRMVYDLGADLFSHLQRLSLRFHGRERTGEG